MSAFLSLLFTPPPTTNNSNNSQSRSGSRASGSGAEGMRQCWICFGEEPHDQAIPADWVQPCRCSGTTAWVHQQCLLDWMEVKWRSGHPLTTAIDCPQCHTAYRVKDRFSLPWPVLVAAQGVQRLSDRFLMYSALASVCVSAYGGLFGYGAAVFGAAIGPHALADYLQHHLTVSTVSEAVLKVAVGVPVVGLSVLAAAFPTLSWVFPIIPPIMYANDVIQWERVTPKLVALSLPLVLFGYRLGEHYLPMAVNRLINGANEVVDPVDDPVAEDDIVIQATTDANLLGASNATTTTTTTTSSVILEDERAIRVSVLSTTGTLMLPFVAAVVGWLAAPRRLLPFYRMLVGGAVVVAVKDAVRMVSWYQQVLIRPYRRVLQYQNTTTTN